VFVAAVIAAFLCFGPATSNTPKQPTARQAASAPGAEAVEPAQARQPAKRPAEQPAETPRPVPVAQAQNPPQQAPRPAQIDRNGVMILIRETLLALDQANKTGNYTVLRDLGSPAFQNNTDAHLAEIFAKQRNDNVDLSGVAVIDPQLTLLPQIEANGLLHMSGFFPSVPTQVNFDLAYAAVNGQWRLFGVSVVLGSSAPVAPSPPPAAAAPKPAISAKPEPKPAAKPAPKPASKPATKLEPPQE
jgi:outer membrane biosynthesis protein TonB